jgi:hypothetical protein
MDKRVHKKLEKRRQTKWAQRGKKAHELQDGIDEIICLRGEETLGVREKTD